MARYLMRLPAVYGAVLVSSLATGVVCCRMRLSPETDTLYNTISIRGVTMVWPGGSASPSRFNINLQANMRRDIRLTKDGGRWIDCAFDHPVYSLRVNGQAYPDPSRQIESALRHGTRVLIDKSGKITALLVLADTPPLANGILRLLASSLQTISGGSGSAEKVTRIEPENDLLSGSSALVSYVKSGDRVVRRRVRFYPPRRKWGLTSSSDQLSTDFRDGGSVETDGQDAAVRGSVVWSATLRRGVAPIQMVKTRVDLAYADSRSACAKATLDEDHLRDVWGDNGGEFAGAESNLNRRVLGSDSFESLKLKTETARSARDLIGIDRKWRALLLLNPALTVNIRDFANLQRGPALLCIASGLALVGTAEVQRIVMELADRYKATALGDELITCLAGAESPTSDTVDYISSRAVTDGPDGYAASVALGILAYQLSDNDPAAATRIVKQLMVQAVDRKRSVSGRVAAFAGLGNSACTLGLEVLQRGSRDKDPTIVTTSIEGLRNIDSEQVDDILAKLIHSPQRICREIAQRTLESRRPTIQSHQ